MYRCRECGQLFEEPLIIYDDPSPKGIALPSGAYVEHHCPKCFSEDIEEADECVACGEYTEHGKKLCDDCQEELRTALDAIAEDMGITADDLLIAIEDM